MSKQIWNRKEVRGDCPTVKIKESQKIFSRINKVNKEFQLCAISESCESREERQDRTMHFEDLFHEEPKENNWGGVKARKVCLNEWEEQLS